MNDLANHTVILGGGFAGLFTALHLSKQGYSQSVTLIDQNERFVFKPLLYEFLSREMDERQVCPRYQKLLDGSGVQFLQDTVQEIDLHDRVVKLAKNGCCSYKHLVLALGSPTGYFGIKGAKENTLPFRTRQDAIALSQHLRECLKQARQTTNSEQRRTLLTVAIVGAGPTGIELAATLADLLPHWYSELGGAFLEIRLVLLNRGSEILKGDINNHLRKAAQKALIEGTVPVKFLPNASVSAVYPDRVEFKRKDKLNAIKAATIVWTTGTTTHPLIKALPIPDSHRDQKGRLLVTPTLQLPDFPDVFAAGDCAANLENPLPPTAQVAYQQGKALAQNLKALSEDRHLIPAQVNLRGSLLKLGLDESAANLFEHFVITGKLAHLIRQGTYLTLLPTPVHNFQATTEWLSDEVFQRYL